MNSTLLKSLFVFALVLTLAACTNNRPADDVSAPSDHMSEERMEDDRSEEEAMEKEDEVSEEQASEALSIPVGDWALNSDASSLGWSSTRIAGTLHVGTVDVQSGSLSVAETGEISGEFVMDMTTINEEGGSPQFLRHVKSEDFFAVESFPTSQLKLTSAKALQGGLHEVMGELTIKDQTHPITFNAVANLDGNTMNVTARFQIDRTKWGITFDSGNFFQNLGDRAIKDNIDYELNLSFELAS